MTAAITALLICMAGGIGAALRFVLDGLIQTLVRATYPVATTVINLSGSLMLGLLTSGQSLHIYVPLFSGLLFGGLAASVVGTGVWRATFAGIHENRLRTNLNALALGLGLGMILGLSVSVTGSL